MNSFKYKHLSKSLLCLMLPILVKYCGKLHQGYEAPDQTMVAKIHRLDSLGALCNKEEAGIEAYEDQIMSLDGMLYDVNLAKDYMDKNPTDVEAKILVDYEVDLLNKMWSRLSKHRFQGGVLRYQVSCLKDSIPQQYREKSALDSIELKYDAAVAAGQCYRDMQQMVDNDSVGGKPLSRYQKKVLKEYRDSKVWRLGLSVQQAREERQHLELELITQKRLELRKTK